MTTEHRAPDEGVPNFLPIPGRTVVILQPTFLPWIGWFDLADQADSLIVLDDVAFSKQSWQQRNRIRTPQGLAYVTVPVRTAGRLGQRILETELVDGFFVEKLIKAISANYARAASFGDLFPEFCDTLRASASAGKLAELNEGLIEWLLRKLNITTPRIRSSELEIDGKRGELVARLCQHVGASCYLSPAGAEAYLLEDRGEFERRSIAVRLHVYEHPEYRQCFRPFVPYASVLDLLMNEGSSAIDILRSGRRSSRVLGAELPAGGPEEER